MRDYTPKISKRNLVHGAYYRGRCRNATIARWHERRQCFVYWRSKMGQTFLEDIKHPEDEQHFDVFVVEERIAFEESRPSSFKEIPFKDESFPS